MATTPLTIAERVNVRRYLGYPPAGDDLNGTSSSWRFNQIWGLMEWKLTHCTDEELVVVRKYLTQLPSLESNILAAADNLDTISIAVLHQNPHEIRDRQRLFDGWRNRFAQFLGLPPGPYLSNPNSSRRII